MTALRAAFETAVAASLEGFEKKKLLHAAGLPTLGTQYGAGDVAAWIPTGCSVLDILFGGGFALGRVSEIFSIEAGEGKTTLLIHAAISVQRAGGVVVWLESEAAIDKGRAARMGLDLSLVVFWAPDTVEAGFWYVDQIIGNLRAQSDLLNVPILVVWDTIAAAETQAEREGDAFREGMGNRPRIISERLRDLVTNLWGRRVHFALVNQSITEITKGKKQGWSGPSFIQPGGKAIKFYSTLRVELQKKEVVPGENPWEADGLEVSVTVKKNKLAPHPRRASIVVGSLGIDDVASALATIRRYSTVWEEGKQRATGLDIYQQSGAWYSTHSMSEAGELSPVKAQGWEELTKLVRTDPGVMRYFRLRFLQMWPLPDDREVSPDGWIRPKATVPSLAVEEKAEAKPRESASSKRARSNRERGAGKGKGKKRKG